MKEFDLNDAFAEWFDASDDQERKKLVAQEKVLFTAAETIYQAMQERQVGKSELADLVNKKPAFITRVLKGDHNITLKTLAELATALDRQVVLEFKETGLNDLVWEEVNNDKNIVPFPTASTLAHTIKVNDFRYG